MFTGQAFSIDCPHTRIKQQTITKHTKLFIEQVQSVINVQLSNFLFILFKFPLYLRGALVGKICINLLNSFSSSTILYGTQEKIIIMLKTKVCNPLPVADQYLQLLIDQVWLETDFQYFRAEIQRHRTMQAGSFINKVNQLLYFKIFLKMFWYFCRGKLGQNAVESHVINNIFIYLVIWK